MSLFDPQTPRRFKNETPVVPGSPPTPCLRLPPGLLGPRRPFVSSGSCLLFLSFPWSRLSTSHFPPLSFSCPTGPVRLACLSLLIPSPPWLWGPSRSGRARLPFGPRTIPAQDYGVVQRPEVFPQDPRPLTLMLTLSHPPELCKTQGVLCVPLRFLGTRKRSFHLSGGAAGLTGSGLINAVTQGAGLVWRRKAESAALTPQTLNAARGNRARGGRCPWRLTFGRCVLPPRHSSLGRASDQGLGVRGGRVPRRS